MDSQDPSKRSQSQLHFSSLGLLSKVLVKGIPFYS